MGNSSCHGSNQLKPLLVGHGFLPLSQLFQPLVDLLQPDVFFLHLFLVKKHPSSQKQKQAEKDHKKHRCGYNLHDGLLHGQGNVHIVDDSADNEKVVSNPGRFIGGNLFYRSRRILNPPVGMVDFHASPALVLMLN